MNKDELYVKELKVRYVINDIEYNFTFPVNYYAAIGIINKIVYVVDEYNLKDWGIELGRIYITNRSNVFDYDQIACFLSSDISSKLNHDKPLTLKVD